MISVEMYTLGTREAIVANARADMGSRNIFRYPELSKDVSMAFVKDHYICEESFICPF